VAKEKKDKKAKKGEGDDASAAPDLTPRLSAHPKASAQIGLAKSWAGLILFAGVTMLSRSQDLPWFDALLRGLAAGIVGYLVAWMAAVAVWRQLAKAELQVMERRYQERRQAEREAREAAASEAEEGR
jgi:uncharacterized membrane protein YccC